MRATIVPVLATVQIKPGLILLVKETVTMDCGCGCAIGFRDDNHEAATASGCCGQPGHHDKIREFDRILRASLDNPTDRRLADVCAEFLDQAFA